MAVSTHRVNTYKLPNQCLASSKSSEKWEIWIKDSFKQAITGVSKAQMITLFSWELQKLSVLKWSHLCQPWQNRPGKAMKSVFSHRYAWEQELSQKAAKNKNLHKGHHNLSETNKKRLLQRYLLRNYLFNLGLTPPLLLTFVAKNNCFKTTYVIILIFPLKSLVFLYFCDYIHCLLHCNAHSWINLLSLKHFFLPVM